MRDPVIRWWDTNIHQLYSEDDVQRNRALNRSYYGLRGMHLGQVLEGEREGIRTGTMRSILNDNPAVNEYAHLLVRDILANNLGKCDIRGAVVNGVRVPLNTMSLEEIYNLYNRVEEASELKNRASRVEGGGKFFLSEHSGGVMVNSQKYVDADGTKAVVMDPALVLDQSYFDSTRRSELGRVLFTAPGVPEVIKRYYAHEGHSLGMTLSKRRGAIMAAVRKAIMPDSESADRIPTGTTRKQESAAVGIVNALGLGHTDLDHFFWQVRNNLEPARLWDLHREIDILAGMRSRWPDYYFKPAGYEADTPERRDEARGMVFMQLLQSNLDIQDDNALLEHVRHITARMQYPTATRERRIVQLARDLAQMRLLRQALATPNAEEAAHVAGKRAARYGMTPEEALEAEHQRLAEAAVRAPRKKPE